ncbi:hypothetical protein F383_37074 [Gossypium arboreum]|uniref:Uncharacterized protein n=1 Tax=Gossypium arboreum TaxID=29729 RepID=A0A0B0MA31_GOSAR|nr:hypothetical protein F383_37074 [Gossypium arboreum]
MLKGKYMYLCDHMRKYALCEMYLSYLVCDFI